MKYQGNSNVADSSDSEAEEFTVEEIEAAVAADRSAKSCEPPVSKDKNKNTLVEDLSACRDHETKTTAAPTAASLSTPLSSFAHFGISRVKVSCQGRAGAEVRRFTVKEPSTFTNEALQKTVTDLFGSSLSLKYRQIVYTTDSGTPLVVSCDDSLRECFVNAAHANKTVLRFEVKEDAGSATTGKPDSETPSPEAKESVGKCEFRRRCFFSRAFFLAAFLMMTMAFVRDRQAFESQRLSQRCSLLSQHATQTAKSLTQKQFLLQQKSQEAEDLMQQMQQQLHQNEALQMEVDALRKLAAGASEKLAHFEQYKSLTEVWRGKVIAEHEQQKNTLVEDLSVCEAKAESRGARDETGTRDQWTAKIGVGEKYDPQDTASSLPAPQELCLGSCEAEFLTECVPHKVLDLRIGVEDAFQLCRLEIDNDHSPDSPLVQGGCKAHCSPTEKMMRPEQYSFTRELQALLRQGGEEERGRGGNKERKRRREPKRGRELNYKKGNGRGKGKAKAGCGRQNKRKRWGGCPWSGF
jgi:regulator of replication initiation timing